MKVYVIRHGQSETNAKGRWTGWLDVNLTNQGVEDAKKAGSIIQNVIFDKIYTSDLIRAIQTATNAIPDCNYQTTPLLREINVGDIADKPLDIITDNQREIFRQKGYKDINGESLDEFYDRINQFKAHLETLDCKNVAVFSHAGWLRTMLDSVVGVHLPRNKINCGNCTIGVFEYNGSDWKLHSWINL